MDGTGVSKSVFITLIVLVVLLLATTGLLAYQNWQLNQKLTALTEETTTLPSPSPAVLATPDPTANWETYSSTILYFKYPSNLTLEEREKDFLVLLSDINSPMSVFVSIDARQTDNYLNYDKAVSSTKSGLKNIQSENIDNGVKISGKVGPGYGEGLSITVALLKHGTAAIEVETTTENAVQLELFDQILSTFKFTK